VHQRLMTKGLSAAAIAVSITAALIGGSLLAAPAQGAPRAIVVWVDAQYLDAATALFANGDKKRAIDVKARDMSTITLDLANIDPGKAPDIVLVDGEQIGELAANALITPVEITSDTSRALSTVAINTFRVGDSLFGTPIQRQNLALVTNAELIPTAPTTFRKLSNLALKRVAAGRADIAFAVAQGIDGNAYSTYPLFSGLGGFAFGTTAAGSYNPTKIGINNKKFVKNQAQIDEWNESGLINSNLTAEEARNAFTSGRAPFWLTSPEEIANLKKVTFRYRITPVPTIVKGVSAAPFMKSIGFAVTTFAKVHKVYRPQGTSSPIKSQPQKRRHFFMKSLLISAYLQIRPRLPQLLTECSSHLVRPHWAPARIPISPNGAKFPSLLPELGATALAAGIQPQRQSPSQQHVPSRSRPSLRCRQPLRQRTPRQFHSWSVANSKGKSPRIPPWICTLTPRVLTFPLALSP